MNLEELNPIKEKLEMHPIFNRINSIDELGIFMQHHVYAVWDFMSLLKKLQFDLIPLGSPWIPNPDGNLVRFINEIVMEEESDVAFEESGSIHYSSHFEIYLQAMHEVGASTQPMVEFLSMVRNNNLERALNKPGVPEPSRTFMKHTFSLIETGKPHEIAASFAIARESVVPLMFQRILDQSSISAEEAPVFRYYLERHTELDGDHHGPMALRLLVKMCEGDEMRENEVLQQAKSSIGQRIELWDGVMDALS